MDDHRLRPRFVPSVSSAAKTNLSPTAHLRALVDWEAPALLLSAYDLRLLSRAEREMTFALLERALERNALVFLDSGAYEARWFRDSNWTLADYHGVVRDAPHSFAFTYDLGDIQPAAALEVTSSVLGASRSLIPIVHGAGRTAANQAAALAKEDVAAIGVTERDLGAGLNDVAAALRGVADAVDGQVPIHVLGAGSPLSILLYVAAGATSFDGLDWCQTVADPATATMHHSKHLPLHEGSHSARGDYYLRLLAHNLMFFEDWMSRIGSALEQGTLDAMCSHYISEVWRDRTS